MMVVIGVGSVPAMADKNDWNSYLEPPGAKPPPIKHTEMASPPAAKPAAVAKAAPKAAKAAPAPKKPQPRVAQRTKSKKH